MANTTPEFDTALTTFLAGCNRIAEEQRVAHYPKCTPKVLSIDPKGRKYIKIVGQEGTIHTGVHCFVDTTNGNVLKAASWSAPAKGARGNIFDEHNGLGRMGPYGPAYNR